MQHFMNITFEYLRFYILPFPLFYLKITLDICFYKLFVPLECRELDFEKVFWYETLTNIIRCAKMMEHFHFHKDNV